MTPEITTLPNGLRVITTHMPGAQSVTAAIFVGVGGRYEQPKLNCGVSHFLEHLLFKGTTNRPTAEIIARQIDAVGGRTNAYTTSDLTNFYVKVPYQHLRLALDVLADMVQNALLDPAAVDRERGVVIEEMNVRRDDPSQFVYELVPPLLWPQDGLGLNVIGNEEVIKAIPRNDIAAFWRRFYQPANLVVSVAGKVKHADVVEQIGELMGGLAKGKAAKVPRLSTGLAPAHSSVIALDTNQVHVVVCARGYEFWHPSDAAATLITAILGRGMSSRLFINVRERKGLAYSVSASYHNFVDSGQFEVYAGVNVEKAGEAMRAIMDELAEIGAQPVGQDELDKAKNQIRGGMQMALESNGQVADWFGSQLVLLNGVKSVEEALELVEAVTPADVQRVARHMLAPDQLRLAVIAPDPEPIVQTFEQAIKEK